jgi:phospholipid transport system transporter-binding protein
MGSKRAATTNDPAPNIESPSIEIDLPADCRMAAQTALLAELLGALDVPATHLDGRAVERVDTAALQLLTLFRREATARGCAVSWLGASDVLCEAAGVLGLARALDLPASVPA